MARTSPTIHRCPDFEYIRRVSVSVLERTGRFIATSLSGDAKGMKTPMTAVAGAHDPLGSATVPSSTDLTAVRWIRPIFSL
jgi:hypothetical protein